MQKESKEYMVNAQSGKSFRVRKGDSIKIIDIEGKQVADFWAIRDDHLDEFFSPGVTLDCNESLYITKGAYLFTNLYHPMFLIEADDVGRHDLLHTFSSDSRSSSVLSPHSTSTLPSSWAARYSQRWSIGLDDLDLVAVLDLTCKPQTHAATAGNHHAFDGPVGLAQGAQDGAYVFGGRQHEDLIVGFDAGVRRLAGRCGNGPSSRACRWRRCASARPAPA